jgi:hypothetical protein
LQPEQRKQRQAAYLARRRVAGHGSGPGGL